MAQRYLKILLSAVVGLLAGLWFRDRGSEGCAELIGRSETHTGIKNGRPRTGMQQHPPTAGALQMRHTRGHKHGSNASLAMLR